MSTIERRTIVDQIEITRRGTVQLRLAIQTVIGDKVLSFEYHRTGFEPGTDLDSAVPVVQGALQQLGAPEMSASEWARVRRVLQVEHTPEVIAAFVSDSR